jgi:MFS family permease
MFIIALSIMQSSVSKQKYALANGILASTYFSGSSIGLVLGGSIIHYFGWRTTFFSLIPIVVVLLVIVIRFLNVKEDQEPKERAFSVSLKNEKNKIGKEETEVKKEKKQNNNDSSKSNNHSVHSPNVKGTFFKSLDIRGVATLAVAITVFLTALTYMENEDKNGAVAAAGDGNLILIIVLLGSAVLSLVLFIAEEKRTPSPLVDLKLIANTIIFPVLIMFLILGFTMFMVYQTVPILVRAPIPLGFGGSAITYSY